MSITKRIFEVKYYILGFLIGIQMFFSGLFKISTGTSIMKTSISDPAYAYYITSYMNEGVLFIQLSTLLLIALTIGITHTLTKSKQ